MHDQTTTEADDQPVVDKQNPGEWREHLRDQALQNAIRKRASGVPSYSVPETAALLSCSPEHLYRLIQVGAFPVVRMRSGRTQGRYVVPAKAVERLLDAAAAAGGCVEVTEWTERWRAEQDAVAQRFDGNQPASGFGSGRNEGGSAVTTANVAQPAALAPLSGRGSESSCR